MGEAVFKIESLIDEAEKRSLLRFSTAGSVDDGKSTLIGRLLYDSRSLFDDQIQAIQGVESGQPPRESLALVTDGLRAEREQGITIDVAYRSFITEKRRFILADSPGHELYTRNMATAASTADLTIVLVDATKGILAQTKRHAFIAALLGVPRLVIAVNKMDLVGYSKQVFDDVVSAFGEFAPRLSVKELRFIPMSALEGENVVNPSEQMPWYRGETLLEHLENVYVDSDSNRIDFRFPIQLVIRSGGEGRSYSGQIVSGTVHVGDQIVVLPSMQRSRIRSIDCLGAQVPQAAVPSAVALSLEHELDISRGDMIVREQNLPQIKQDFEAMLVWMDQTALSPSQQYFLRHTTRESRVFVNDIFYKIDVNSLSRLPAAPLELNEIGRVSLTSTAPLMLDSYSENRATGNFILIDPETFQTVAAGMVIDRHPLANRERKRSAVSTDLHEEKSTLTLSARTKRLGYKPLTIWFTGLSGSGKSTAAKALEELLFERGYQSYRLDGDNLRRGLNSDLDFSAAGRTENIRRAAEVSALMNGAGVVTICALISPMESDRAKAREIVGAESFIEVYFSTPINICEGRDPHGLYQKARAGEIAHFTGVTAPYEPPTHADLVLDTSDSSVGDCAWKIFELIRTRSMLN